MAAGDSTTFVIQHDATNDSPLAVDATFTELADGSVRVDLAVANGYLADLRGFFFDLADNSLLGTLSIDGADITGMGYDSTGDGVIDDKDIRNLIQPLDFEYGVELGTPGAAADDIRTTSFVISSSARDLTLSDFSLQQVGVRATSVGLDTNDNGIQDGNESRSGSAKIDGEVAAPESHPDLSVVKYVSVDGGQTWLDANAAAGEPALLQGHDPQFEFVVTNTGNVDLSGVTLTDNVFNLDGIGGDAATGDGAYTIGSLAAGASTTVTYTGAGWAEGQHTDTATASGSANGSNGTTAVSAQDDAHYLGAAPAIDVQKYVSVDGGQTWQDADTGPGPTLAAGDNPEFKFVVTNTGNVDLAGVTVADDHFSLDGQAGDTATGDGAYTIGSLAAGASATIVYTDAARETGQHTDLATATGAYTDTAGHTATPTASDAANYVGASSGGGEPGSISGHVFLDANCDGVQRLGDPAVAGVTVQLLDAAGNATGLVATTDEHGNYSFEGVTPGTHSVAFVAPDGTAFTEALQGGDPALDSDADPLTGHTQTFTLAAGEHLANLDAGLEFSSDVPGMQDVIVPAGGEAYPGPNSSDPVNVEAGAGDQNLHGGGGSDILHGSGGNDIYEGAGGNDTIIGCAGNDTMQGEGGNDFLWGGAGNDDVTGNDGNDFLSGGDGNDRVAGSTGDDTIVGGADTGTIGYADGHFTGVTVGDQLFGDGGADHFVYQKGDGVDWMVDFNPAEGDTLTIYGYSGFEVVAHDDGVGHTVLYLGQDAAILLNGPVPAQDGHGNYDGITFVPDASADPLATLTFDDHGRPVLGADHFPGDQSAGVPDGSDPLADPSTDTVTGSQAGTGVGGDGSLYGLNGDDTIAGTGGNDTINANEGANHVDGGAGDDLMTAGNGDDVMEGGAGNDTIYANEGANVVHGGLGDDQLFAGNGDDLIDGGAGNDTIYANTGADTIVGGAGNDVLFGAAGNDVFVFSPGDGHDTIGDFNDGDVLDLRGFGFATTQDVLNAIHVDGSDAVLQLDADTSVTMQWQAWHHFSGNEFLI